MTRRAIQPGIVFSAVCGEQLLIATRRARGKCPYVKQLNATGAYFWSLLEQGLELEDMIQTAARRYQVEPERIRPGLVRFMEELAEHGYLLLEEPL